MELYQSSRSCISGASDIPSLQLPLNRNWKMLDERQRAPMIPYTFATLVNLSQVAYQFTTGGKFQEAFETFRRILHLALFVVVPSDQEASEVRNWISHLA